MATGRTQQLYTIGYAGHTLDSFIATLQSQRITALVDIRMTPISRKKGFSKTALRQALADVGILYYHIRALGSPALLRHELQVHKDYPAFFAAYSAYLQSQEAGLEEAIHLAASERACLMCVEQCASECHRSVVADTVADAAPGSMIVRHLHTVADDPIKKAPVALQMVSS